MDDEYETEREILKKLNEEHDVSWARIAEILGGNKTSWWYIGTGKRDPTREQRNQIRSFAGLPLVPKPVGKLVEDAGVSHVIRASDSPDTAILVGVNERAIRRVSIVTEEGSVDDSKPQAKVREYRSDRHRKPRSTITLDKPLRDQLNAIREELDLTWNEWAELYLGKFEEE